MIGSGLKNGILFFLIILILHFLIKNILLERSKDTFIEQEKSDIKNINSIKVDEKQYLHQEKSCDQKKEELYKYVMEAGDLEKIIPKSNDDSFQDQYNLVCDTKTIMEPKDKEASMKKPQKPSEQAGSFLTIHEYTDESPLNGGNVFDGIGGYDGFDDVYQSYSCTK